MTPELADMYSAVRELKSDEVVLSPSHNVNNVIWVGNGVRWIMQIGFSEITDLFRIYDYVSNITSRNLTSTQVILHLADRDLLKDPWLHGTRMLDGIL